MKPFRFALKGVFVLALLLLLFVAWILWNIVTIRAQYERRLLRRFCSSRREGEAEAERIWETLENPKRVRGRVRWEVLDIDRQGQRALVQTESWVISPPLVALVGRDMHTGRSFFMPVAPNLHSIPMALEWLWGLPDGSWSECEVEEH
jgi:hypothetical protein